MTRAVGVWCVLGTVAAGCGGPPEFAIELENPTDCDPAALEVARYWISLGQSGGVECTGGDCQIAGEPRDCLAGVATPAVTPRKALTVTVGVYDDAGQLIACGRSDPTTVGEGSTVNLTLSCDVAGCPNVHRVDCPAQTGSAPCPIINGIEGAGACTPWEFVAFEDPCTNGYTRTRDCDAGFECRTTDLNGCDSPLNLGQDEGPPPGCPSCGVE